MDTGYSLGDLLADPHLNLQLVTGSAEALTRPLHGAHSIEIDHPSQWLDPGWLMLTMGIRLRQRPSEQRQLITELQELGATALGFGVGVAFKNVPPALLEEAEARNFPVIKVPVDSQFHEISRVVFQSNVSSEAQTYARLTSLQQNLMRAFEDPDPLGATLRRLARFANSVVAIMAADGTVHASTGPLPVEDIAHRLSQRPLQGVPACVGEFDVVTAPLGRWPSHQHWYLVLAGRSGTVSGDVMRMMVSAAVPILEALGTLTAAQGRQDQALSKAMLDNALSTVPTNVEAGQFAQHLATSGVDAADGFNCTVIRSDDTALLDEIESGLTGRQRTIAAVYSRRHLGELVAVVAAEDATVDRFRVAFGARRLERLTTGIGRTVTSARELAVSHRDATIVLRYLEQELAGCALTFDDLDLASQLLAEVPAERVAPKVKFIADLLESNPIQLEALRAYFATCQDVQAAAKSIFVHPNTLRYRLERFETAMGRSLRDPAIIASLHYVLSLMHDGYYRGAEGSDSLLGVESA